MTVTTLALNSIAAKALSDGQAPLKRLFQPLLLDRALKSSFLKKDNAKKIFYRNERQNLEKHARHDLVFSNESSYNAIWKKRITSNTKSELGEEIKIDSNPLISSQFFFFLKTWLTILTFENYYYTRWKTSNVKDEGHTRFAFFFPPYIYLLESRSLS